MDKPQGHLTKNDPMSPIMTSMIQMIYEIISTCYKLSKYAFGLVWIKVVPKLWDEIDYQALHPTWLQHHQTCQGHYDFSTCTYDTNDTTNDIYTL